MLSLMSDLASTSSSSLSWLDHATAPGDTRCTRDLAGDFTAKSGDFVWEMLKKCPFSLNICLFPISDLARLTRKGLTFV